MLERAGRRNSPRSYNFGDFLLEGCRMGFGILFLMKIRGLPWVILLKYLGKSTRMTLIYSSLGHSSNNEKHKIG